MRNHGRRAAQPDVQGLLPRPWLLQLLVLPGTQLCPTQLTGYDELHLQLLAAGDRYLCRRQQCCQAVILFGRG